MTAGQPPHQSLHGNAVQSRRRRCDHSSSSRPRLKSPQAAPRDVRASYRCARHVMGLEAQAQRRRRSRTTNLGHAASVSVGGIESHGCTSGDIKTMADKERLQEFIKYRVEWIRLLWITLVAVGSGEVSLLLGGLPTLAQKGAAVIGIMFLLVIGLIVSRLDKQAREAIEKLREV